MRRLIPVFFATSALLSSTAFGQIVIQHLGSTDPVTEGFTLSSTGDVQLGLVFDDLGFNSWMIHSRVPVESATYRYSLTPDELQATLTYGWVLTANMRFVEVSANTRALFEFHLGSVGFRLRLLGNDEGEIIISSSGGVPDFVLEGNPLDYHEYMFVYDAALEMAALWIDGVELVTGIPGGQTTDVRLLFGASGESVTYSHWNEVTLTIIPEPATVVLLTGLGSLLLVAGIRWRRRRGSGI